MKKDTQLANEIKKLQYQLSYSEHINKQLSEYLANLCQKTGMPFRKAKSIENVNLINTQAHLQELYYVEPLLMAYQHKIHLLEEELRLLRDDSESLLKFGEQIVKENNFLRKQLQSKNEYIVKSDQIGLNVNFLKLDNQTLIQKNNLLREKNQFLMQKVRELQQLNQRQKINQIKPNISLNETMKQLRMEKERIKNTEIQFLQMQKQLEVTLNQLNNERSLLKEQERKNTQLENELIKLRNQLKINKQQHEAYQIAHDGTVNNLEVELQALKNQLLNSQRRQNQLFTKNMAIQSQLQDKNSKCHNLTLQNTQLQTNNNNILQMLETYEVKVNSQNKKTKQLEADIKDYNETTLTLRKEGEMLSWKLQEKEKQMERKETDWKKERERLNKIWEERLDAMKKVMVQQKDSLYDEIQGLKGRK